MKRRELLAAALASALFPLIVSARFCTAAPAGDTAPRIVARERHAAQAEQPLPGPYVLPFPDDPFLPQRAVLLEEDAAEPFGRGFLGQAYWHIERAPAPSGTDAGPTVVVEVAIPQRKLALRMALSRNPDPSVQASHIVELAFRVAAPHGEVRYAPGILMKRGEETRGSPLAARAVKAGANRFRLMLSEDPAERTRNLTLLRERAWFDVPIFVRGDRRAIIAIDKGSIGERLLAEALRAWGD